MVQAVRKEEKYYKSISIWLIDYIHDLKPKGWSGLAFGQNVKLTQTTLGTI